MFGCPAVPNYLRTKLGLDLEAKQKDRWNAAASKQASESTMEEIKKFNAMLTSALEHVKEEEDRKTKSGQSLDCFSCRTIML